MSAKRGHTAEEVAAYDRAKDLLTQRNFPVSKAQKQALVRKMADIEAAPEREAEAEWRRTSADETVALAAMRDEEAEIAGSGAIHVFSRDGLLALLRIGRLTADQYDAGMDYRACWERAAEQGAQELGSGGGVHNNDRYVWTNLQSAKAMRKVGDMDRAIAVACRDEPAALQMVRWVAGQGNSPRAFGGGRAYDRHVAALCRGLNVIADMEPEQRTAPERRKAG